MPGLMALLINKWNGHMSASGAPDSFPQMLLSDLLKSVVSMPDDQATNLIRMAIVFTMAANLKSDRTANSLLQMLVDLLGNKKHGSKVAKDFRHVLAPSGLLNNENFALMRGLYKQRPYGICVPRILELFKACADPEIKSNYLVALSGILMFTPKEVLLPAVEALLPMILQSMDATGPSVKAASINVVRTAIVESPSSVEGHIRSIIHRLLDRIRNTLEDPSDAPSAIRVIALNCLGAIPGHLNTALALSYKAEVMRALESALNDVRRNVRDEAVRCRFAWFGLVEKAEESD
jgi:DNA repair/transcription protein MET18/MMS19